MNYYYSVVHSYFNNIEFISHHENYDEAINKLIQLFDEYSKTFKTKVINECKFLIINDGKIVTDIYEIVLTPYSK